MDPRIFTPLRDVCVSSFEHASRVFQKHFSSFDPFMDQREEAVVNEQLE